MTDREAMAVASSSACCSISSRRLSQMSQRAWSTVVNEGRPGARVGGK